MYSITITLTFFDLKHVEKDLSMARESSCGSRTLELWRKF